MRPDGRLDRVEGNRRADAAGGPGEEVGLCGRCRHARVTRGRGPQRFWRCGRSDSDPRFARYPGLPVSRCAGFAAGEPGAGAPD
jgi:hypothetical protein